MSIIFRIIRFDSTSPPTDAEFKWDVMGGTMGRSSSNDWVLPDTNRYLSGRHAVLRCQNGDYYITDTSTNGVFINQKPVPLGRDNSARLEHGDTLRMGGYVMEVLLDTEKAPQPEIPEAAEIPPASAAGQGADYPFANDQAEDDLPKRPTPGGRKAEPENLLDDPFAEVNHPHHPLDEPEAEPPVQPSAAEPLAADFWESGDSAVLSADHSAHIPDDPFFSDGEFMANMDAEPAAEPSRAAEGDVLSDFYQPPDIRQPADEVGVLGDFGLPKVNAGAAADDDPFDFSGIGTGIDSGTSEPEPEQAEPVQVKPVHVEPAQTEPAKAEVSGEQFGSVQDVTQTADSGRSGVPQPDVLQDEQDGLLVGQTMQRLLAGMGIADESTRQAIAEQIPPEKIGQLFRMLLQGSMDVLRTRAEIKSEMRMDVTTIQPIQNNPVKFSVSVDDALLKLLLPQGGAFMKPELAVAEAFDDIKAHQVAVIAGVQASLKLVMKRFDPDKLVERLQKQNRILANIPIQRQAHLWGLFEELYSTIEEEASDDFQRLFGLEFARAYEQQIKQLEMMRGN